MSIPSVVIVSPALADANNGNWRTAERWQRMLAPRCQVRIVAHWPDGPQAEADAAMLALHARRSAASVQAWALARPGRGLAVVLTGTDLYQDCAVDAGAQRSLALAQRLVVLQERGPDAVPQALRHKTRVIFQSAEPVPPVLDKDPGHLRVVMVGHLRPVKAPRTLFAAARLLGDDATIRIDLIGGGEGAPALADEARATARDCPAFRWLGPLGHAETLEHIRRAHVLVHTSTLEGGAHVLMEAVQCATPVLASDVPGNVGMLGQDYSGYIPVGDAAGLAGRLRDCRRTQAVQDPGGSDLASLRAQCALRAPLFSPTVERAGLSRLVEELLALP